MKRNVAQSDSLLVDRPLNEDTLNNQAYSLWSIPTATADYADTCLRFFLVLCLVSSLVLCGMRVNNSAPASPSLDLGLSLKTLAVEPSLPQVGFGVSIR